MHNNPQTNIEETVNRKQVHSHTESATGHTESATGNQRHKTPTQIREEQVTALNNAQSLIASTTNTFRNTASPNGFFDERSMLTEKLQSSNNTTNPFQKSIDSNTSHNDDTHANKDIKIDSSNLKKPQNLNEPHECNEDDDINSISDINYKYLSNASTTKTTSDHKTNNKLSRPSLRISSKRSPRKDQVSYVITT